jgi:cell division transport system permease protein
MVVSVVLVTFISLTFFGAAILLQSQISADQGLLVRPRPGRDLLCTDISTEPNCARDRGDRRAEGRCPGRARGPDPRPVHQEGRIRGPDEAYANFLDQFEGTTAAELVTPTSCSESFRVNLIDPNQADIIIDSQRHGGGREVDRSSAACSNRSSRS